MKNALVIVTLSVMLSACAAAKPPSLAAKEDQKPSAAVSQGADKKAASDALNEQLPSVELTEDLLFKLLRAELANQRGDWQLAYITMLVTAQETRDPRLARRAAEIALNVKKTGEALSAVRLWRELAPNSDEASQFYLGLVVIGDNLAEAKPIFTERLQEVGPQARGLLILQIQRLLARTKDKGAAFKLMEELVAPYPGLVETHIALAQSSFANGDLARARAEAAKTLEIKPDLEIAALMLAQTMPNRDEALQSMAGFLKAHPKARDVRIAYAKILIDDKQYAAAQKQFAILLKEDPNDLTILYAMGILGAQMDDRAAAEKYLSAYLQVLENNPDDERDPVQALLILSQIAEDRKDFPAALKWLAQVEPGTAYLDAQIRSAQIMAATGDLNGARNLLSHLKPEGQREQIQVMVADAQLLRDATRVPEALAILSKGLERFPADTGLLYDYAMLAEKADKLDLMEAALRKIIRLAPDNQHAYNALGYSYAERNIHLQEAYTLIEKALKLTPEDPFIMDSMGWVQFRLGKLQEAEDFLRRAYALRPDVEIGVHLGEVLWVKGDKEAAQKLWRDARQKDPQNELLKSTLTRLRVPL
ncbi:tetratricopeptide repeat protein [Herminiimonas sp.]|uniref:tetratricopeptide repeat protein n=1 Tax=Herminiimonas sp. TaxID=1926289 RepID=UPI002721F140|nr:tetratricopeptide repeat protein [Herminiimonas sp.]MDO8304312.1 tetratricopeptide repeat protein [Herminiimonas sp.]